MARIAVVHVPFFSHVEAATRLTAVMSGLGHDVTAWGPGWSRPAIEAVGARFESYAPAMPDGPTFIEHAALVAAAAERYTPWLVEQLYEHDVDLVVHDSLVLWARIAADHLGLPRIVSHPMYPIIAGVVIGGEDEGPRPPRPDPAASRADFERSWRAIAERYGVEIGTPAAAVHSTRGSDATVLYTTEEVVAGAFRFGETWVPVGPLMTPAPARASSGERPLVYACFGTCFNRRRRVFDAVIEALADEPVDVLISTGRRPGASAEVVSAADLGALPANIVARDFVPGRETLAGARVHITHGGCNSVHESLLAAVPMLFSPQAYDQFPLARRIELHGNGRIVHDDPEAIRDGVRWLLEDPAPQRRADELARHLAGYDGEARVAALLERVLGRAAVPA